jgi:hypothetical protein
VLVLLGLALLAGCAELEPPSPTPIVLTATPRPTRTPRPTATPLPSSTPFVEDDVDEEDTPTPLPPTLTPTPPSLRAATATPTFPPNPPDLEAVLESSYARMAGVAGYSFTATVQISNFNQIVNSRITGTYVRPNRLHWTTTIDDAVTEAIIVGEDYFVSLDQGSWTQVPRAKETLDEYRLWTTLHDAVSAEYGPRNNLDLPVAHLGYTLDAAHLPLPPQMEPWRVISVGVWIGREDQWLHRIDLAAQTANYLLEEHMYFFDFGEVADIEPPAEDTQPPEETP